MKQTVHFHTFQQAFEAIRPDNFSYEGLTILFDYLTQLEDDIGEESELDVIALCCDYTEEHWKDVIESYSLGHITDDPDLDEDDQKQAVMDWLCDNTSVCGETSGGSFIYCSSF